VIRAPLKTELEEQLAATSSAAKSLMAKAKGYAGAADSCKTEKGKARNKKKSELASSLHDDAVDQARSLESLINSGHPSSWWADRPAPFREHTQVNVEQYSLDRQERDILLAELSLTLQECFPGDLKDGVARRWAQSRLDAGLKFKLATYRGHARIYKEGYERAQSERNEARAKLGRSTRRINELKRRAERLEGEIEPLKVMADEAAKDKAHAQSLARSQMASANETTNRLKAEVLVLEAKTGRLEVELRYATAEFSGAEARLIARQRDDLMRDNNSLQAKIVKLCDEQSGSPTYPILRNENERLAVEVQRLTRENERLEGSDAEVQRLTRENERLDNHIDRISGRSC
jgi:hypothetical protein